MISLQPLLRPLLPSLRPLETSLELTEPWVNQGSLNPGASEYDCAHALEQGVGVKMRGALSRDSIWEC